MTQEQLKFNPNPLVAFLQKPQAEFTKQDILKIIEEFQIEMINFRYMADDGRLHTLNFVIQSLEHADEVLTSGEREMAATRNAALAARLHSASISGMQCFSKKAMIRSSASSPFCR